MIELVSCPFYKEITRRRKLVFLGDSELAEEVFLYRCGQTNDYLDIPCSRVLAVVRGQYYCFSKKIDFERGLVDSLLAAENTEKEVMYHD